MRGRSRADEGRQSGGARAFTSARVEMAKLVAEQPDYAEALCALGMADAALGYKDDAIREGRRAAELVPVAKDSIVGASVDPNIWRSFMRGRARRILPSNS